uniref:Uncharacterized protein n=1 Tax=Anguilla anguilla TaxID=7936 RepID=A0A0E9XSC4_ANGAN
MNSDWLFVIQSCPIGCNFYHCVLLVVFVKQWRTLTCT